MDAIKQVYIFAENLKNYTKISNTVLYCKKLKIEVGKLKFHEV
jgi:hypothetical protein